MKTTRLQYWLGGLGVACLATGAFAQAGIDHAKADAEFAKFRAEMEDSNPAELNELKGEELWKARRGPKNVSLADTCDLGLGLGKLDGAYVQMPRYFADANAVMDTERRIAWCMIDKQGYSYDALAKKPFQGGNDSNAPEITDLVMYIAGLSRGKPFAVNLKDPKVLDVYETGKEVVKYRAGPYDFSCNTCHGSDGRRIRMQNLPNISTREGATKAVMGWPAYRMTGGVALTMQWRMNDCFRQQRFPEPKYASDVVTALLTYMTANANDVVYGGPGIKR